MLDDKNGIRNQAKDNAETSIRYKINHHKNHTAS